MRNTEMNTGELVDAPFQENFKVRLDWDLSNLIEVKMPVDIAEGIGQADL